MCPEFYTTRQPSSRDSVVPGWCDGLVGLVGACIGGYLSGICLVGSGTSLGIKGAVCWVVELSGPILTNYAPLMFNIFNEEALSPIFQVKNEAWPGYWPG